MRRGCFGGCGEYQIREKFTETSTRQPKFTVAGGAIQPTRIDQADHFGPRVGCIAGEADFAEYVRDNADSALLDIGNASCHSLIAPRPCAKRNFFADSVRFGAALDESRPPSGCIRFFDFFRLFSGEPLRLGRLPRLEHLHKELVAIMKVPVEAAFADA